MGFSSTGAAFLGGMAADCAAGADKKGARRQPLPLATSPTFR